MDQNNLNTTLEMTDFIQKSPSMYHVVENAAKLLEKAGFEKLDEKVSYKLEPGKMYYVTRNGSALCAFALPKDQPAGFNIIASHTDSPCFKLKENPEIATDKFTTLNVEAYGGMIMAPWFDRPLSVAGRAFVKQNGHVVQKLVNINKDLCSIVNLCIHQNRDVNKGHEYKVQKELLPILCDSSKPGEIKALVAKTLEVEPQEIIDMELFLYNRQKAVLWGTDDEFFSSPRIDDLMCVWSSIKAITQTEPNGKINMAVLFDNEEVGSGTKQGACSDFMIQTIERICQSLGYDKYAMQASSFMLSADNGHSFHPNYPEMCDPVNKPCVNKGVLIKYAGNQKYTTDGLSGAIIKEIFSKANVPYQVFFNNSNVSGGSTLGNLSQSRFSIPAADIGCAQLAMHSPYETAGTKDILYLLNGMKAFYTTE